MSTDNVMMEMASEQKIEKLHADTIDRVERYINQYHGGECDMRTLIRVIIKKLGEEQNSENGLRNCMVSASGGTMLLDPRRR
jgi:hypothetical protein